MPNHYKKNLPGKKNSYKDYTSKDLMIGSRRQELTNKLVEETAEEVFGNRATEKIKQIADQDRKAIEDRREKRRHRRILLEKKIEESFEKGLKEEQDKLIKEKVLEFHMKQEEA